MTPAARVAAAIDILDAILEGTAAEKVLTGWGRKNRYAGSGDRAAIRDHVFQALRQRRSYGHIGGGDTGRGLMLGWAHTSGSASTALFSGEKYAPDAIRETEITALNLSDAPRAVQLDCPDWLLDRFDATFGEQTDDVLALMQGRAPVFLRVNLAKCDVETARTALLETQIETAPHPLSETALEVLTNPRRIRQSEAYLNGMVELQDAASQAVVDFLKIDGSASVLDYCAGGGGKSLAIAASGVANITCHDQDPLRMKDIPARAERAGATLTIASNEDISGQDYDLVLCDAPCSGSGSWRRSPDAKWRLTGDDLQDLTDIQTNILGEAKDFVSKNGMLAYVTCSVFSDENTAQVDNFLKNNADWTLVKQHHYSPLQGGDGFFVALLKRE
ncbi:MAG: RsmB/NOP family class I SAM-dependent RNA methyltransferase [Paracoccaceae bacterium]